MLMVVLVTEVLMTVIAVDDDGGVMVVAVTVSTIMRIVLVTVVVATVFPCQYHSRDEMAGVGADKDARGEDEGGKFDNNAVMESMFEVTATAI